MLQQALKKLMDEEFNFEVLMAERVYIVNSRLQVTSFIELPAWIVKTMQSTQHEIIKQVKESLPACIDIQVVPYEKKMCLALTLEVGVKHNTVEEINTLAQMAIAANRIVIAYSGAKTHLSNIWKDMKPFIEDIEDYEEDDDTE